VGVEKMAMIFVKVGMPFSLFPGVTFSHPLISTFKLTPFGGDTAASFTNFFKVN
jgi:hypothetical protein